MEVKRLRSKHNVYKNYGYIISLYKKTDIGNYLDVTGSPDINKFLAVKIYVGDKDFFYGKTAEFVGSALPFEIISGEVDICCHDISFPEYWCIGISWRYDVKETDRTHNFKSAGNMCILN
jgi:hypothetical protein